MVRNRAVNAASWTFAELWLILLRQFKHLLAEKGVDLTDAELHQLAHDAASRQTDSRHMTAVRSALVDLVQESVAVLQSLNLTYAASLAAAMNDLPGWETTADFLELANEKGNAELRISTGSALLAGLGDRQFAQYLWDCYQHGVDDPEDVDAVIAKRALLFAAQLPPDTPDAQIKSWLENR